MIISVAVLVAGAASAVAFAQVAARRRERDDARIAARRWITRLGGQLTLMNGADSASQQALWHATERLNAASSRLSQATTVKHACHAADAALEGLYYVQVACAAMGLSPESCPVRRGGHSRPR